MGSPILKRFWRSAVGMTWLALTVRLAGFATLLPIVLAYLSPAEVSVWLAFSAIASLQVIADFGFGQTFSREIAYGFAGRSLVSAFGTNGPGAATKGGGVSQPNWGVIASATGAMLWLYRRVALVTVLLLAVLGSWAVMGPVARTAQPDSAWIAWCIVVLATGSSIYGNSYSAFLIGANRIDLQKRWETFVGAGSVIAQVAAVLTGGGLLGLVVVAQIGVLAQILVNRALMARVGGKALSTRDDENANQLVLRLLWPAAWRTAIGTIMSLGVSQGLSVAMANILVAAEAAGVQLALRIMQVVSQFSQVPFYARIPQLNRLRAGLEDDAFMSCAKVGVRTALWGYVIGVIAVDTLIRPILNAIGSQTKFPADPFWVVLALAGLAERYGAMHVNLLLTRNRAIAHVANGVAGAVAIAVVISGYEWIGALVLPLGMLAAYGGFYAWFAAFHSHRLLPAKSVMGLEVGGALLPATVAIAWVSIAFGQVLWGSRPFS